ncbi:autotransporter outer membrane beta-barrel domain-containing protein [Hyphomicrobium sulfonivorans]|nr:autotransporter domain-containing protein [Hyphomicrobium sulfonivorans]
MAGTALSGVALADGGNGGESGRGNPGGIGGGDGADGTTPTNNGSPLRGGGGGGGGGAGGGNGAAGANGVAAGGAGGAGGTLGLPDGAAGDPGTSGGSITTTGGGGGGGGYIGNGAGGTIGTNAVILQGGAGGAGGNGGNADGTTAGGGGGGGAGGYGAIATGGGLVTNTGSMTGGAGGAGGAGGDASFPGAALGGNGGDGGDGGAGLSASTGTTVDNRGIIQGGNGGAAGAGGTGNVPTEPGQNGAGGAGIVGSGLTITNSGTIIGGLSGDGVTRANAITFTGGGNTLTLHSSSTITGNVDGGGGAELHFGGATNGSFDVSELGTQYLNMTNLEKKDSSDWTFTGLNSTFVGSTLVSSGALAIDATFDNSYVTVGSGATLRGIGTTGGVAVLSGGIHAPGNAIGAQTINGNYTLASGAILQIEADSSGANNKVVVLSGGVIDITGSILQVIAAAGTYAPATQYLIIDNQGVGAVTGTFASITSSLAFLIPTVSYTGGNGNDVVLTLTDGNTPVNFCSVATTMNQCNVANAAQKLGAGNPIYDAILVQTAAGAQQAFNAFSGEVHAAVSTTLANDSRYVRDIILQRLRQAYYARTNGSTQSAALATSGATAVAGLEGAPMMGLGMGSGREGADGARDLAISPITFWTQGYGAWADFDGNGNAAGANRTLGGFMSGMDAMFSDSWRIGGAFGYARSGISVGDGRFSSADVDSYQLAAYTSGNVGSFVVRGGLVWSWSNIDSNRAVIFPGFAENVSASYNGNTGQVFGEVALPFSHSHVAYEPFGNLAWVGVDMGGFTEGGGIAALSSGGSYDSVGYTSLGLRVAGSMFVGGAEVIPRGSVAWLHAFGDVDPAQGLVFAAFGQSFVASGVPLAPDSALIDAGFDVVVGAEATLGLFYTGQFADNVQDNAISGRLNWRF